MQIGHSFIYVPNEITSGILEAVTYIQYDNFLKSATVLQGGDIAFLHDNLTNLFLEIESFPKIIEVQFDSEKEVNCVSIAGCNFKTSGASFYIEIFESGAYTSKGFVSGLNDNQPSMICFESVFTNKIKITISGTSKIFLGELAVAKALKMPTTPSVGYKPARWNIDDEITHHVTQSLNIGRSTINVKGSVETLPFKLVNHTWMRNYWEDFIKNAKGLPVWVGWNPLNYPSECIYGSWKQDDSSYNTALYSSLNLTITGNV